MVISKMKSSAGEKVEAQVLAWHAANSRSTPNPAYGHLDSPGVIY